MGSERDLTEKIKDRLAYHHCRIVNPKADHPRMGYYAFSEDQRRYLQDRQQEAADEIVAIIRGHVDEATEAAQ